MWFAGLRWLAVLLLVLTLAPAQAATYAMTTVLSNWIDASTHSKITANSAPYNFNGGGGCGSTPPTLDDVISDLIPIGFSFMFGGVNFADLRVMTNGRLQFGNATCGYGTAAVGPPQTFPYSYPDANMNRTMRIYGGDLDVTLRRSASTIPADSVSNYPTTCTDRNACYISYALIGTAPNRSFVVTWNNVPEWVNATQTAGNFNLQIILQENGEFIYQYGANNYASTGRAQIGWQVDSQDYEVSQVGLPAVGTAFKYYIPRPMAEYRMEQPVWTGAAGEILDTSGNGHHATRVGAPVTVPNQPGYICRGSSIPANTGTAVIDALGTPVNVSSDVGSTGSITFWHKPVNAAAWSGNTAQAAMLFDATTASGDYFFLAKIKSGNNARLRFVIRDSGGVTRSAQTGNLTLDANGAVHVGVVWSFNPLAATNADFLRIYVNGVSAAQTTFSTDAGISASLGTLHIGDNRSTFVENVAYGRSANGVLDEFRIYNFDGGLGLILRDMNQANACLDHYAIAHSGTGFTCVSNAVTVSAHNGAHGLIIMPNNTTMVRLTTSTGSGDWSLISGYGALNNGAPNDGEANYVFNGEYQAVFGLSHTTAGTVNINVTDGQIIESGIEDPNLLISSCTIAEFNACEKTSPRCVPQRPIANGYDRLFTKLSNTAFDMDFVALKADGTLDDGFNAQVNVSLLANLSVPALNPSSNCPTSPPAATINLGSLAFSGGRASSAFPANAFSSVSPGYSAYKDVRVSFSCTVANCGRLINQCSSDQFTIRPQGFAVTATTTTGTVLNNSSFSTGNPALMAGRDFLLKATAVPGYSGAPSIKRAVGDQTVSSHLAATDYVGNLRDASGSSTIALGAATVSNGVSASTVQYHDYGQFRLLAGAVRDSAFAAIDAGNGDCITGSTSNVPSGRKYGCDIANQADTGLIGRFYPSYFAASGALTPACAGGNFSYFGQPFTLTYSIDAKSFPNPQLADTATMTRYDVTNAVSVALFNGAGAGDLIASITPSPATGAWANGVFMPSQTTDTYTRGVPEAPVEEGYLVLRAVDPDGALIGLATAAQTTASDMNFKTGTPACTSGCTHKKVTVNSVTAVTSTRFRYGRLWLGNTYGSERSNLSLPYETQYWNGFAFVKNTLDSCTALSSANVALANKQGGLTAYTGPVAVSSTSGGAGNVTLTAPGTGLAGSVDVLLALGATGGNCNSLSGGTAAALPYLSGKWCAANYDRDPVARASFGIFRSNRQIYLREGY